MRNFIELWVCDDCMFMREYDVVEDITDEREAEIRSGLHALQEDGRHLANDCSGEWGDQLICRECGFFHSKDRFGSVEMDGEEGLYVVDICPECHGDSVSTRDHGYNEFSWNPCDCCNSPLGGSRHRYALFHKD